MAICVRVCVHMDVLVAMRKTNCIQVGVNNNTHFNENETFDNPNKSWEYTEIQREKHIGINEKSNNEQRAYTQRELSVTIWMIGDTCILFQWIYFFFRRLYKHWADFLRTTVEKREKNCFFIFSFTYAQVSICCNWTLRTVYLFCVFI